MDFHSSNTSILCWRHEKSGTWLPSNAFLFRVNSALTTKLLFHKHSFSVFKLNNEYASLLYPHVHTHTFSGNPWYSLHCTVSSRLFWPMLIIRRYSFLGSSALLGPNPIHEVKQGMTTTHHEQPCLGVLSPAWVAWNPGSKNWFDHKNITE